MLHLYGLLLFVGAVVVLLLCCSSSCNAGWDLRLGFFCHWRWGECEGTTFDTERTWVYANTTWSPIQTHMNTLTLGHTHINTHVLPVPQFRRLDDNKKKAKMANVFPRVSCFVNLQWVCGENGSWAHTHTQLQARNTLGCWIMRVDRAELSLHITIILSFSQLPQHLPWRCDISILLEFNLGPLNKTIAYRPFPNGPSPILITWN